MLGRRSLWEIIMPWLNPYCDWRIRRRARKDARSEPPIPAWKAEALTPYLRLLSQAGTQDIHALAKVWHAEDRRYKTAWTLAVIALEAATRATDEAREKSLMALAEFERAHGHRLVVIPSRARYAAMVALLCLFEFPLNAIVFRGFGESELFTWLMALGFGIGLTWCAHHLGKLLREKRTALQLAMSCLFILLPSVAIIGVATLRANYLAQKVGDISVWSPGVTIPFFIAWNLIFYSVATVASFRHHDPFRAEVAATQRELLRAEYAREMAEAAVKEARVRREKRFAEKQEHAAWLREEVKRLASLYWTINLQVRHDLGDQHDTDFPRAFEQEVEVEMPEELRHLVWEPAPIIQRTAEDDGMTPARARRLMLLPGDIRTK